MDPQDLIKKKNDLMKSIMTNPKLAKTFKNAMSSPIGSTHRDQARSVLSIMKKVSGLHDGQGGLHDGKGGPETTFAGSSSLGNTSSGPTNFGNMLIFPAAPSLKIAGLTVPNIQQQSTDGLNVTGNPTTVPNTSMYGNLKINSGSIPSPYTIPQFPSLTNPNLSGLNLNFPSTQSTTPSGLNNNGKTVYASIPTAINNSTPPQTNDTALTPGQFGSSSNTTPTTPDGIKELQTQLNNQNSGKAGWVPLIVDGIMGPKTKAAMSSAALSSTPIPQVSSTSTPPQNDTAFFDNLYSRFPDSTKPATLMGQTTNASFTSFANALVAQESGGSYTTVNKDSGALGKYQIMPFNLGYAGLKNTPEDIQKFLGSPDLQDKAFSSMISELYTKYGGDLVKVAAAYYGGNGAASIVGTPAADKTQGKYPSINEYVTQVLGRIEGLNVSGSSVDPNNPNNTGGTPTTGTTYGDVQKYVNAGTGSYAFAEDLAKNAFAGRSLPQVQIDNLTAYKKALEPLETQLNNLKAESENFVPTLTSYMQGKDQYSQAIDKMIQDAEGELLTTNMADPYTANQYKNNLTYLYTLKGRQSARYGTYLNNAITDYNADVTKTQNNFDTFKSNATDLLTAQNTLDQDTYNSFMTRGAALYTEMENAPTKAANMKILMNQAYPNGVDQFGNALGAATGVTNPDYYKDKITYTKDIAVDNGTTDPLTGTLDWTKVPIDGLIGYYTRNLHQGGDEIALTDTLGDILNKTLEANSNDPAKVFQVRKMINDLASYSDEGATIASNIANKTVSGTTKSLTSYITTNMANIKGAVKDLVSKSGGFLGFGSSKSGIQDKETWKKNHSNLDSGFLDALYDTINTNVGQGTAYSANPQSYIDQLFSGKTDQENAQNLAARVAISS